MNALRLTLTAGLAATLTGCGLLPKGGAPWNVPTTVTFVGTDEARAREIEGAFVDADVQWTRKDASPLTYELRGIETTKDLAKLSRAIDDALERTAAGRPEVFFSNATLGYMSLEAAGDTETRISIAVTPGAAAYIADGPPDNPWRSVPVDAQGAWSGRIDTSGMVGAQGGWLYIAARAFDRMTWSRINVLTGQRDENVGAPAFGAPSLDAPARSGPRPSADAPDRSAPPPKKKQKSWMDSLFGA